ncbi:MAG TPA: Lrp/AsnC family transcriptional regulator [Rhabdaerophilum sp.]|nr:Lrp/AsnC family transcriptional regulator [Rhabdaerophilum sp.]
MHLTETDRRILRYLQRDVRLSNQELAEAVAMSPSACWRRVKALEEAGVISGYAALLSADRAGFHFSAILHVTLARHEHGHVDQFIEAISRRPEVLECFATTGEADYHLRVVSPDKDAYNRFLDEVLFRLPGVSQVRTNVVLKEIKLTLALPV